MTGPVYSILGIKPELSVNRFLGGLPRRYEAAPGPCKLNGALYTIDTGTKKCVEVQRVDISDN